MNRPFNIIRNFASICLATLNILISQGNSYGESEHAVTYLISRGSRLGDHLVDYTHAKWISYKYGFPLYFQPFKYSEHFVFHDVEQFISKQVSGIYSNHIKVTDLTQFDEVFPQKTLFYIQHFPDSLDEFKFLKWYRGPYIPINWDDETFRNMMRNLIKTKKQLNLIDIPKDIITVALHFRTGEGFDSNKAKRAMPLRFANFDYFLEQLLKLHAFVNFTPIYVYIFTDHPDPIQIKNQFVEKNLPNITFDCRTNCENNDLLILEDLFSMMQFDCLIRPVSHFSIIASHLGDFKLEIFPKNGYWNKSLQKFIITEINFEKKYSWDSSTKTWNRLIK